MAAALATALARPSFRGLDVVSLDPDAVLPWREEFYDVLRQGLFPGDLHKEYAVSDAIQAALFARHPGTEHSYRTTSLPLCPLVLLDAMIYAGHYAHGPIPGPGRGMAGPAGPGGKPAAPAEADIRPLSRTARPGPPTGSCANASSPGPRPRPVARFPEYTPCASQKSPHCSPASTILVCFPPPTP
jgi:hypothetical protein